MRIYEYHSYVKEEKETSGLSNFQNSKQYFSIFEYLPIAQLHIKRHMSESNILSDWRLLGPQNSPDWRILGPYIYLQDWRHLGHKTLQIEEF